jgi:hypothetical protein
MQKPLIVADWNRLEDALAGTSFWRLDPDEEFRPMFNGSDWTIRGRQGGRSPCIKRRSPYGPIRDLGELFIELAGSEAINEYSDIRRHSRCRHKIKHRHSGCRARPKVDPL